MDDMSDVDTNGFRNAFDEHIRSISKQVIEEEFAKHQTVEIGRASCRERV